VSLLLLRSCGWIHSISAHLICKPTRFFWLNRNSACKTMTLTKEQNCARMARKRRKDGVPTRRFGAKAMTAACRKRKLTVVERTRLAAPASALVTCPPRFDVGGFRAQPWRSFTSFLEKGPLGNRRFRCDPGVRGSLRAVRAGVPKSRLVAVLLRHWRIDNPAAT
jgi:hypothetical protein